MCLFMGLLFSTSLIVCIDYFESAVIADGIATTIRIECFISNCMIGCLQ